MTYPDGGVRTSVSDLSRFFAALLDGGQYRGARILAPELAAEMLRFQYAGAAIPDNVDPAKVNSGIFWSTKLETTLVGHGGSDPGLETVMLYDPKAGVGLILFTNTAPDETGMKAYIAMVQLLRERGLQLKAQTRTVR
ncbi:serine hydrolase [Pseudoxanthomonas sp. NC8]|nr:serine hydrolase [Pseudoxanthomonas sp. NC8]